MTIVTICWNMYLDLAIIDEATLFMNLVCQVDPNWLVLQILGVNKLID